MQKVYEYINDNTQKVAIWFTAASVIASLFFLYYFDRLDWMIGAFYLIPVCVYHGIMNSNHKTRKN